MRFDASRLTGTAVLLALATCAAALVTALPAAAQSAFVADGPIESTAGGFVFPDGSVQSSAAGATTVPDTGLQGCWDGSGASIACSGTGQDGELQRGTAWPAPRFTPNGDGTVTDHLTGLIWLADADCFGDRTWEQALADANTLMGGSCGLTDGSLATEWRLPNIRELLSLVDYGQSSPALPTGHPFPSLQLFYWSSTTAPASPTEAWVLSVGDGASGILTKTDVTRVWPVRGGQ